MRSHPADRPAMTRRSTPVLALITLCALALVPSGTAFAHESTSAVVGTSYKHVRGLGPAKSAEKDLLKVKLADNTTMITHGLDPEPAGPDRAVDFAGPERQPVCATDYFQHVLYGYPAGAPNRIDSVKATILAEMKRMNALLNEEALASGGRTADYKVRCDAEGEIRIDTFQSDQANAQTNISGVVSAARDAGFDASNADYTIFFDSNAPPACGAGTLSDDQRLTAENQNNSGGDYAVVYSDCWTASLAMHENGHNQGAVQHDAPYSTGNGAHCNDGHDIMCYSDGGDKDVGLSVFCNDKMRFDCRNDTYFDTAPEPNEYLSDHWNLGSPLNRFIAFDDGPRLRLSSAGRYARSHIKRKAPRATRIHTRCVRRTRTSATCRVRWRLNRGAGYRGRMIVKYRYRGSGVALATSVHVRRTR